MENGENAIHLILRNQNIKLENKKYFLNEII